MKILPMLIASGSLVLASTVFAGGPGGCIHEADYGSLSLAKKAPDASEPLLSSEATDPRWLALQKRLQLEAAADSEEIVVVPN